MLLLDEVRKQEYTTEVGSYPQLHYFIQLETIKKWMKNPSS